MFGTGLSVLGESIKTRSILSPVGRVDGLIQLVGTSTVPYMSHSAEHTFSSQARLVQPIARIYNNVGLPVHATSASQLQDVGNILLPPARLELDSNFDRLAVVESSDRLTLIEVHVHAFRVEGAEDSKCNSRNDVREVFIFFVQNADLDVPKWVLRGLLPDGRQVVHVKWRVHQISKHPVDLNLRCRLRCTTNQAFRTWDGRT